VRRLLAWWPVVAGVVVLVAGAAGLAAAAPVGSCTTTAGTIVAVDFGHWGGPVVRGCGIRQPTGFALLHAAGFTTAGDGHDGAAFICRVGDAAFRGGAQYPTASQASCTGTPSATDYWSYWVALAGQNRWSYSALGAMSDVPKPGEVELWTFGSTDISGSRGSGVPTFSPAKLRAENTAPAGTTTATQTTSTRTAASTPVHTASTPPPGTHATAKRRAARHTAKPRTTRRHSAHHRPAHAGTLPAPARRQSKPTRVRRATSPANPPVVAARPTRRKTSAGSAVPLVIGILLVLALLAGAGWAAWRRRRDE
jgi:hypothetical protein